jgi:hypothetical protein
MLLLQDEWWIPIFGNQWPQYLNNPTIDPNQFPYHPMLAANAESYFSNQVKGPAVLAMANGPAGSPLPAQAICLR